VALTVKKLLFFVQHMRKNSPHILQNSFFDAFDFPVTLLVLRSMDRAQVLA